MKQTTFRQFNRKVILSGNILELYEYEKPVCKGLEKKRTGRSTSPFTSDDVKKENREKTAQRARQTVRRMVNANPQLNKFFTLTFAENITDLDFAHYELDKFIKRLKSRCKNLQYVNVVEFQNRGAVHFHLLCNLPYIPANELAEMWGNGFVKINRIDNVDNVGAYITKYMTKDSIDERLIGRKCYSMSKSLNKPNEYTKDEDIDQIFEELENVKRIYSNTFESEYYGQVCYTQIVCTTPPKKPYAFARLCKRVNAILTPLPDCIVSPFD